MTSKKTHYRYFIMLCLVALSFQTNGQNMYVPYRVGDKFGISDENGNLKLSPVFDNVRLCAANNYFTGYTNKENGYTSSLMYRDKIIIADQNYFGYYAYNDIVVAVMKTDLETGSYYSFGNEISHVYNNKGKRILPEEYSYVEVYEGFDQKNESPLALIGVYDIKHQFSLFVYNKPQGKMVKELLSAISIEEINAESAQWNNEMTIVSKPINRKATMYTISYQEKEFKMTQEDVEFHSEQDLYWDAPVAMPNFDEAPPAPKPVLAPESIQTVERRLDYKQFNAKDRLYFESEKLNTDYFRLIKEDEKIGIKRLSDDKILVPPLYDALFRAEFAGIHYTGYIVLADGKYGVSIQPYREEATFIAPQFAYMPWMEKFNYGKEGFHLIALYDADGVFHHFANQNGKEYYRPK